MASTSAVKALKPITPRPVAPALAGRVLSAVEAEHSANTLSAYRSAWAAWSVWADAHGVDPLPAAPGMVAAYLTERAEHRGLATVRLAAAAVAAAHRAQGYDNPVAHQLVRATLKGLSRQAAAAGTSQAKQAGALTDAALAAIRASACIPRRHKNGRIESDDYARARGLVDIALVQTMADAGLRRSEAAALAWRDVERQHDRTGRLLIRRSKTDQEGAGTVVAITARAMHDLTAIRGDAEEDAPVFGLSKAQIHRRIRAAARAAGLGDDFGGHSGRVGLARRMVANGAPMPLVMQQGRWAAVDMVARYTRGEAAGKALKYL